MTPTFNGVKPLVVKKYNKTKTFVNFNDQLSLHAPFVRKTVKMIHTLTFSYYYTNDCRQRLEDFIVML